MLRRFQSLTQLRLTSLGFVLAALPLATGIITAIIEVGILAESSRDVVVAVQRHTDVSRRLASQVEEMVRSGRQYAGLGDDAYLSVFDARRREVLALLEILARDSTGAPTLAMLESVREAEQAVTDQVHNADPEAGLVTDAAVFEALRQAVERLVARNRERSLELANRMSAQAGRLQQVLAAQAMLVLPLSAVLALAFLLLISRPMRKLDHSIRELGRGNLESPIEIRGTRDVVELGQRLDWLRERLLDLEQQKLHFLRNVSHELKTPLTNIREACELLVESEVSAANAQQQGILRILRDNSVRLQAMIEDLLRFGAHGNGDSAHGRDPVALHTLVAEVIDRQSLFARARDVALQTELAPLVVPGSARQLELVVDNLLSNAIKYSPRGGTVALRLYPHEGKVRLDVSDTGPGVRSEHRPRVFDWFFSGPRPRDCLVPGTGMGLAIAREYAQRNGGDIQLLETARGAYFRLTLGEADYSDQV